jgi:hypothetical protein
LQTENEAIGDEISILEKVIAELRASYKKYLLKWM